MITVSRLLPVAILGALSLASAARAVTFDFSTSSQYTDNFAQVSVSSGSSNALAYSSSAGGSVQQTAAGAGSAVFAYTGGNFGSSTISFDFSSSVTNTSFGVYFGGANRTSASLALFNLNTTTGTPGDDTIRFFTGAAENTGGSGTILGSATTLAGGAFTNGSTYRFTLSINYLTATTANATVTISDPSTGISSFSATSGTMTIASTSELAIRSSFNGGGGVNNIDNVTINPSAVPEPSTYAAIAGAGVLGLAVYLRRKRC